MASDLACQFPFRPGNFYLVYAYGNDLESLTTKIGDRTRNEEMAKEDFELIGEGEIPHG